ncbi:MAG: hypothetical protein COB79_03035 [Zetaproteobacteria bacterium]|nr:MAG: hypothetical protein COB79_03035 [Zetaproteobacteria bacterium]
MQLVQLIGTQALLRICICDDSELILSLYPSACVSAVQTAAFSRRSQHFGIVDNWIRGIRDNFHYHQKDFEGLSEQEVSDKMTELNVMKQVENLSHTRIVQNAWEKGRPLTIHGWVYRLGTGIIHDLKVSRNQSDDIEPIFRSVPRL